MVAHIPKHISSARVYTEVDAPGDEHKFHPDSSAVARGVLNITGLFFPPQGGMTLNLRDKIMRRESFKQTNEYKVTTKTDYDTKSRHVILYLFSFNAGFLFMVSLSVHCNGRTLVVLE